MGGGQQQETSAQRAMVDHATNLLADYKNRWLPVQQQLAAQIQAQGAPGSAARKEAAGKSSTDTAIQFDQAKGALEKSLANSGAGLGSGKATLGITGMGQDAAKSTGLGAMISDQQIDDAYMKGLSALTSIGRGERASVGNALASQASQSAYQASADANASLMMREGIAGAAGTAAGYGLQSAMAKPAGSTVAPQRTSLPDNWTASGEYAQQFGRMGP